MFEFDDEEEREKVLDNTDTEILHKPTPSLSVTHISGSSEAIKTSTSEIEPLFEHDIIHSWESPDFSDIVICPSLSFDVETMKKITGYNKYEERQLFNFILLRYPAIRLIFLSSEPLDSSVVEYYWKLLPTDQISFEDIRKRVFFLSTYDPSPYPLSKKVLDRPRLLKRISKLIRNPQKSGLVVINSTKFELELAAKLHIKLLANHPSLAHYGTKQGSKEIFQSSGVLTPLSTPLCFDIGELAKEIVELWLKFPDKINAVVIKHNEGFSGKGNAILDLTFLKKLYKQYLQNSSSIDSLTGKYPHEQTRVTGTMASPSKYISNSALGNIFGFVGGNKNSATPTPTTTTPDNDTRKQLLLFQEKARQSVLDEFQYMRFVDSHTTWESYHSVLKVCGVIAEQMINCISSPSGQATIGFDGQVQMLSTHEQILGGADGQIYLGCSFPADKVYRLKIQQMTLQIGKVLANKGVVDIFGVDFLVESKVPSSFSASVNTNNPLHMQQNGQYQQSLSSNNSATTPSSKGLGVTSPKNKNNSNIPLPLFETSDDYNCYAIEINIRALGTTHPLQTMKLLTDGVYNMKDGNFLGGIDRKTSKFYFASDNVMDKRYKGLMPLDILEFFEKHPLHWNSRTQIGVVFHMLGALSQFGKIGMTSIADSKEDAQGNYFKVISILNELAEESETLEPLLNTSI